MDDECVWLDVRISSPVSLALWEMMSHLQFNQFLLSAVETMHMPFPLVFLLLQTDLPLTQQVYFLRATK